ncbi:MAG: hypothetical protein IJC45_10775 [Clostridia bacterium]|nr:hypothetical protein [Clostridia bacterium]
MIYSNIKVEQINDNYEVVEDYGEILSKNEVKDILLKHFKKTVYKNGCLYGEKSDIKYCIYFKNISYLGTPHPFFKKRIQIGDNFKEIYKQNEKYGIKTLLIGVYKYKKTLLFVDFDTTKYVTNKSHNSSAHVYTIDLKNGLVFGVFQKEDIKGNLITVFTANNVEKYLESKLIGEVDLRLGFITILDDFYASLSKHWFGIEAYQEMITAHFNNAFQPEWPGFYHEFKLDTYIKEHPDASADIQYKQNKGAGEIDLDLFFPKVNTYGDLKAHSNDSSGIQGNDWNTIMRVLEKDSIYYIVLNHDTEKDFNHKNEVTIFWNTKLGKKNLLSYANKMKHSVKLTSYCILEINKFNKQYLDVFHQGHNSDGSPRNPKIKISNKNISNFLIHQWHFNAD